MVDQIFAAAGSSSGLASAGVGMNTPLSAFPISERVGRTVEMIGALRHLWSDNPAPFFGRYHKLEGARLRPLPLCARRPPIHLAGLRKSRSDARARLRTGSYTAVRARPPQPCNRLTPISETALDWVADERGRRGLAPDTPFAVTLLVNAFVSRGDPWSIIGPGVIHQSVAYARWKKEDAGLSFTLEDEAEAIRAGQKLTMSAIRRRRSSGWADGSI